MEAVKTGQFSQEKIREIAELGNKLVTGAGGYREAARQLQKYNLDQRENLVKNVEEDAWAFPAVAEALVEIMTKGVCPSYYGPGPAPTRQRGYPYQGTQSWEIIQNLWKLIAAGKMLVCTSQTVSVDDAVEATPCCLIPKRNPDRAISADSRLISDLRRVNLGFNKSELYPVVVPMIYDIIEEILRLNRKNPGLEVVTCKRDVDSAFTRIYINPDVIRLITTEFRAEDLGWTEDLICGHLCLPFGWVGSPAFSNSSQMPWTPGFESSEAITHVGLARNRLRCGPMLTMPCLRKYEFTRDYPTAYGVGNGVVEDTLDAMLSIRKR